MISDFMESKLAAVPFNLNSLSLLNSIKKIFLSLCETLAVSFDILISVLLNDWKFVANIKNISSINTTSIIGVKLILVISSLF